MNPVESLPYPAEPGRTATPRVLVSAPDAGGSGLLERLSRHGLAVLVAPPGGLTEQVAQGSVDLVLLHGDSAVARADLRSVRQVSAVPVVVLLCEPRTSVESLLASGADDCVAGSVGRAELVARIRAVLRRRASPSGGDVLRAGAFVMDLARHVFERDHHAVHLPPKEFGLLELLIRRDGRVVRREEALAQVWGPGHSGDPTTVDVHVKRLRAKVEADPGRPEHLLTVRGLGYRFQA